MAWKPEWDMVFLWVVGLAVWGFMGYAWMDSWESPPWDNTETTVVQPTKSVYVPTTSSSGFVVCDENGLNCQDVAEWQRELNAKFGISTTNENSYPCAPDDYVCHDAYADYNEYREDEFIKDMLDDYSYDR